VIVTRLNGNENRPRPAGCTWLAISSTASFDRLDWRLRCVDPATVCAACSNAVVKRDFERASCPSSIS
jgi:hypothetical protein